MSAVKIQKLLAEASALDERARQKRIAAGLLLSEASLTVKFIKSIGIDSRYCELLLSMSAGAKYAERKAKK